MAPEVVRLQLDWAAFASDEQSAVAQGVLVLVCSSICM